MYLLSWPNKIQSIPHVVWHCNTLHISCLLHIPSLYSTASSSELEKQSFLDHIEQAKLVTNQSSDSGTAGSHVIKIVGCVTNHIPLCLVCEIPSKGDLLTYLQEQRAFVVEGPSQGVGVTPESLLNFVEQFVSGMVSWLVHVHVIQWNLSYNSHLYKPDF